MSGKMLAYAILWTALAVAPLGALVAWKGRGILWLALAAIGVMGGSVWVLYALFDTAWQGFASWKLLHVVGSTGSIALGAWAFSRRPVGTEVLSIPVTVSLFWLFFAGSFAGALWGAAYFAWRGEP